MPKLHYSLIAKITGDYCDQSCIHCRYTGPIGNKRFMSEETLEAMLRNYLACVDEGCIEYQSGEPTLAGVGFYRRAVEIQREIGVPCTNSLQTHGLNLDDEWVDLLKGPGGWVVGLSHDGPDNSQRGMRTEDLDAAANLLREAEVPYSVLCVVGAWNIDKPKETVRHLAGVADHVQFINVMPKEPGGDAFGFTPAKWWRFLAGVHAAIRDEALPIAFGNKMTVEGLKRGLPGECTQSGCRGYLVALPDGRCAPCDFKVEEEWILGSFLDTSFTKLMRSGKMDRFAALHDTPHEDCEPCKIKSICGRGCQVDRWLQAGRWEDKNPLCSGFEFLDRVTQ